MAKIYPKIWDTPSTAQLATALAALNDATEVQGFLRDVMTEGEIIEIAARFEAARLLVAGSTYTEITQATKLSSRTVARISDWLQNGTGGYAIALEAANEHRPASRLRAV